MTNLPESSTWEAGIYQLETTDPVLGGPTGIANQQAKQLANRTKYLRDQLDSARRLVAQYAAGVRPVLLADQHGRNHPMLFVPRFRFPAGALEGWPAADVTFPAFLVDQFAASHPSATPTARGIGDNPTVTAGTVRACSAQGVVPWTNLSLAAAKQACANREIMGAPCRLMRPHEWMALQLLSLANETPRGNNALGRDSRDADVWDRYGVPDPTQAGRALVGAGPLAWSHNGIGEGVADWIGNVGTMLDVEVDSGRYIHMVDAVVSDPGGISGADNSVTIAGVHEATLWPSSGLLLIEAEGANAAEYVAYASIANNGDGTYTLGGLARAQLGTSAGSHGDGAIARLRVDFCLVPGGASAYLSASVNDSSNPVSVAFERMVPGPGSAGFVAGREIVVDNEVLLINSVSGGPETGTLTCARAQLGTSAAAHSPGAPICMRSTTGGPHTTTYQTGYITALRDEPLARRLGLPAAWSNSPSASEVFLDVFRVDLNGASFLRRGGNWSLGGLRGWTTEVDGVLDSRVGFRCVRPLEVA
jgi:hypothetical protein